MAQPKKHLFRRNYSYYSEHEKHEDTNILDLEEIQRIQAQLQKKHKPHLLPGYFVGYEQYLFSEGLVISRPCGFKYPDRYPLELYATKEETLNGLVKLIET
ncbi:hypothetical protein GF396_03995 [Candidatus Pacearchaeota archaeon]|nr:hypothetical protein [Candidatus Pacearchaeota archaeon]